MGMPAPQTVWTEAFIWMERWVEGTRAQQMKLTAAPWSFTKVRKRVTKQFLWLTFSLFTGLTFVGYFQPISQLFVDFFSWELNRLGTILGFVLRLCYLRKRGFHARYKFVKYMCPYARFQSAMFDAEIR